MARVDDTGGSGYVVDNGTGLNVRTKINQKEREERKNDQEY